MCQFLKDKQYSDAMTELPIKFTEISLTSSNWATMNWTKIKSANNIQNKKGVTNLTHTTKLLHVTDASVSHSTGMMIMTREHSDELQSMMRSIINYFKWLIHHSLDVKNHMNTSGSNMKMLLTYFNSYWKLLTRISGEDGIIFKPMNIYKTSDSNHVFWVATPCSDMVKYKHFGQPWQWRQQGPQKCWYPTTLLHWCQT
jgi:hypothetical protein